MAAEAPGEDQARLWKVTISVIATAQQVEQLTDRFVEVMCPDPGHEGPCPVPWALHVTDGGSLSKAEQKRLRAEIADTAGS